MSREVKSERSVIVVSDLDSEADEKEIAENFEKYGRLHQVLVAKQRPWVALVYFDDKREAREAARCLDGSRMSGSRVTVELASGIRITNKSESSKVYMYDLGNEATKREICEIFKVFGKLKHVWTENQNDKYVAIVYEKAHQARDAVRNLDGTLINGKQVRVKLASERDTIVSQGYSEEVYVGNLGSATDVNEIEETFMPFGALRRVWVSRNPEVCALVWFKDERDAKEAAWCLDKRWLNDRQISVKLTRSWSKWCCWLPKHEGNNINNITKPSTVTGYRKTSTRTVKVSFGFDCIYTKSYKDDQLHENSMKSAVVDDKTSHAKTSKCIPNASVDDWDGNKANGKVSDEGCAYSEDRVRSEGSSQKRKIVEVEGDKIHQELETTSKFHQLAQTLEYRPRDEDDYDAVELQSSDVTRNVICANGGSVDKKSKSVKAKIKIKSTTEEPVGDKKKKLENRKRKKSKNKSHSPDGRSKSSSPSYEYKSVENGCKVNNNISISNNDSNNSINNSDNTFESVELPDPENKSAQSDFNLNNVNRDNNNGNNSINSGNSNSNNIDNTGNSNSNNIDNTGNSNSNNIENTGNSNSNNIDNTGNSNSNNIDNTGNSNSNNIDNTGNNDINNSDNTYETVEFPVPENILPVVDEIVPRPAEEPQNNTNEEQLSDDLEMRNPVVVAAVNDSQNDDAMAMTSQSHSLTSLPSTSSSADPTTTTGLPLVRVKQTSSGGTPTGVCPQPSTIYIHHYHHHHHYHHYHHYHHHNQHRLAGEGDFIATTESNQ